MIAEVPAVSPVKLKVAIPLDPVVAVELAITVVVPETANIALPGTTFPAASLTTAVITRNSIHLQATRTAADLPSGSSGLFQDAGSANSYVVISADF